MNIRRHVQAVLWSFVGLGRRQDMAEVDQSGSPQMLIAVGIGLTLVFVGILLGLASFAVSLLGPAG
jgi:hypothetical protein